MQRMVGQQRETSDARSEWYDPDTYIVYIMLGSSVVPRLLKFELARSACLNQVFFVASAVLAMSDDESESASNEAPDLSDDSDSDDDTEDCEEKEKRKAGAEYSEMLINIFLDGLPMSAMTLCILSHYAEKAGLVGFANKFSMPPGKQMGKYSRRAKQVLEFDKHDSRLMKIEVPGQGKYELSRSSQSIWVLPPNEALHDEVANTAPSITDRLRDSIRGNEWADNYNNHRVVRDNPDKVVVPLALYVDGAPFTKQHGFVGFWDVQSNHHAEASFHFAA